MLRLLALFLLLGPLVACGGASGDVSASLAVADAMSGDTTGYARADRPRAFVFPADHGPHPAFKTEWWYVTGNLRATDGTDRRFGLQFTVFRSALSADTATARQRPSAWAANQLYMAHVGLSDVASGRFYAGEALRQRRRRSRGRRSRATASACGSAGSRWRGPGRWSRAGRPAPDRRDDR